MTAISYFQWYSHRENHITNNTLLMMRHLYEASPAKLRQVLRELLDDDKITVGPTFQQQVRGSDSVPDAVIRQSPFRLYIETKRGESLNVAQLRDHVSSIARDAPQASSNAVLIGLTTAKMREAEAAEVGAYAREHGVIFKSVTFGALAQAMDAVCDDHEVALKAIVSDYIAFLRSERLLDDSDGRMLVAPCGTSFEENAQFGVYYDDYDRPRRAPCRFFGAYKDKCISLVGEIKAVVKCGYGVGEVIVHETERGDPDPQMIARIKGIIEATPYYPLKLDVQRYYIMDRFVPTRFIKTSKGPIRGAQYIHLEDYLGKRDFGAMSSGDLAFALDGVSFQ